MVTEWEDEVLCHTLSHTHLLYASPSTYHSLPPCGAPSPPFHSLEITPVLCKIQAAMKDRGPEKQMALLPRLTFGLLIAPSDLSPSNLHRALGGGKPAHHFLLE